jgi:hypothetical protein
VSTVVFTTLLFVHRPGSKSRAQAHGRQLTVAPRLEGGVTLGFGGSF